MLFFAQVRELTGVDVYRSMRGSRRWKPCARRWRWSRANCWLAVNQSLVTTAHPLAAGDEMAFFPPVTGG
ncbi:MAG: MoaD/ThiS family protein [Sodalis sp. (in: enterobacteria)]